MGTTPALTRTATTVMTLLLFTIIDEIRPALAALTEHRTDSTDNDSVLALPIQQFCPYSTFCERSPLLSNLTSSDQTCCLPCSCHEKCSMTGSCCPDAPGQKTAATKPTPVFPCRNQKTIYETYLDRRINLDLTNALDYHVVDRCPPEANIDADLRDSVERCGSGNSDIKLQDLIFVSGTVSGIVYLNLHCAKCNGEKDFIKWDLYVIDETFLRYNVSSQFDRDQFILQQGSFFCVPPSKAIGEASVCKLYGIINTCNVTNEWDVYDTVTENKCLYGNTYYYIELDLKNRLYANVHCYLCNKPAGVLVPGLCENIRFGVSHIDRGIMTSFTALVRPELMTYGLSTSNHCAKDEALNPLLNKCLRLFCPPGSYVRQSVCEQLTDNIIGYGIEIFFDIEIQSDSGVPFDASNPFLEGIASLVSRMIRRKQTRCDKCVVKIFEISIGRGLLTAILVSTVRCSHLDLLRLIWTTLQHRTIEISTSDGRIRLKLNESLSDAFSVNPGRLIYSDFKQNPTYTDTFTTDLVYCPSLEMNIETLNGFVDDGSLLKGVVLMHVSNETVRVCISDLEQISRKSHVGRSGPNMVVLALLLSLTYVTSSEKKGPYCGTNIVGSD